MRAVQWVLRKSRQYSKKPLCRTLSFGGGITATIHSDAGVKVTVREKLERNEIENLRRTRDLLLPRLLSGCIPLDDLPANATETVASQTSRGPRLAQEPCGFG